MPRQRGQRHYINNGEELHVGPLRILVNAIHDPHEGDKASVSTFVFFTRDGEGITLGSGTVKLSMLEELKQAVEHNEAAPLRGHGMVSPEEGAHLTGGGGPS
jgi:hypothetical protein